MPLLGLPTELRYIIFECAFDFDSFPAPFEDPFWGFVPASKHWQLQVRLTCRQIDQDISSLVFSKTRFVVRSFKQPMVGRLRRLPPNLASAITSLELASYLLDFKFPLSSSTTAAYDCDCEGRLQLHTQWVSDSLQALPNLQTICIHHGPLDYARADPRRTEGVNLVLIETLELHPMNAPVARRTDKGVNVLQIVLNGTPARTVSIHTKRFDPERFVKARDTALGFVNGHRQAKKL